MANTKASKLIPVHVENQPFKLVEGQEVFIFPNDTDIKEGIVVECGSYQSGRENYYRIQLTTGVRTVYPESLVIGRRFGLFDKQGNALEGKIFLSLKDAIDAEEDGGYDNLTAQYETANGMPDSLTSEAVEIWEVNEAGVRFGKAIEVD